MPELLCNFILKQLEEIYYNDKKEIYYSAKTTKNTDIDTGFNQNSYLSLISKKFS